MTVLRTAYVNVLPKTDEFDPELKKRLRRIDASKEGEHVGATFGGGFGSKLKTLGAVGVAALGGVVTAAAAAAGGAAIFGLKTAASLEQAQIGFETLLGSGQKATAFLGDLKKFAASTPFELPGLIESSRTLLGVGLDAKQVVPTLRAFGDAAGAVGVGQENFQRIMLATSQAISAGKFQTEDLNQIMENGIPIWTILSKAMGKPVPELRTLASEGKLLSKDVLPLLEKQMGKDYGGAMARQSQTLAGVWSTLKDTVSIGLANALQPLVPILTDLLPKGAAFLSKGLETASLAFAGFIAGTRGAGTEAEGIVGPMARIGAAARTTFDFIRDEVLPRLRQFAGFVRDNVIPAVSDLAGFIGRNRDFFIPFVAVLGGAVVVFQTIAVATKVWAGAQALLNIVLAANPIGLVIVAIAALVAGIIYAYKHSETFREIVNKVGASFLEFVGTVKNTALAVAKWAVDLYNSFLKSYNDVKTWGANVYNSFQAFIATLVSAALAVRDWAVRVGNSFLDFLNTIRNVWNGVTGAIRGAVDAVADRFNHLKTWITETLPSGFRNGVNAMGEAWDKLKEKSRIPVAFVVNSIINPLIGGWNNIAGVFGAPKASQIQGFAGGGIAGTFPGYTPGRDIHAVPMSMFSGGEAVMRPEWTRAMGPDYVRGANAAAKRGGISAVMDFVGHYADGGILDLLTSPINWVKGKVGGAVGSLTGKFGSHPFVKFLGGMGKSLMDAVVNKAKSLFLGGGGPTGAGPGFGAWPAGPPSYTGDYRDSGVWRSIAALIQSTGPLSGSFGNAYRPGDPLWHGAGRAVDWMGYNQDQLASFFMARMGNVLELIHRTNSRDYAITRGRNMGSFTNSLMEAHRNHIHIAMANGGIIEQFDSGGPWPTGTLGYNGSGKTEYVLSGDSMNGLLERVEELIDEVRRIAPGVGREINGTGRGLLNRARAT